MGFLLIRLRPIELFQKSRTFPSPCCATLSVNLRLLWVWSRMPMLAGHLESPLSSTRKGRSNKRSKLKIQAAKPQLCSPLIDSAQAFDFPTFAVGLVEHGGRVVSTRETEKFAVPKEVFPGKVKSDVTE